MRTVALCLLVLGAILAACGTSASPSPSAQPRSSIDGVVVRVESTGLNKVTSFALRMAGGAIHEFKLDRLEDRAEFPPGHLTEHQANADPVRVYYMVEGDIWYATRIEDDPMPAAT